MIIEKILKTNSELSLTKKTVVSLIYKGCKVYSKLNDALKPFDISIQQFNVLRILRGQKGKPVPLGTVQERMITEMSNTTRLIDKLSKKGFTKKNINIENRRKVDIIITKEGLELLDYADKTIDETEISILSNLTKSEKETLIRLLGRIS